MSFTHDYCYNEIITGISHFTAKVKKKKKKKKTLASTYMAIR